MRFECPINCPAKLLLRGISQHIEQHQIGTPPCNLIPGDLPG